MPIYKIIECDNCGKHITRKNDRNEGFLIYSIKYWNKKEYESNKRDYLLHDDCALILCSEECIGKYISKLLKGEIIF